MKCILLGTAPQRLAVVLLFLCTTFAFGQITSPLRNLDRMHLELRSQLTQRFLAPDRFKYYLSFELRTVLFSRRRHQLLPLTTPSKY